MKKWIIIGLMLLSTRIALAESVTVQGGLLHTNNSNYGDSGQVQVRGEKEVLVNRLGTLSGGLEYAYHGPTSRFPEDAPAYGDVSGHTVMLEAIYYTPEWRKTRLYALAGFGYGWWDFDESEWSRNADITVDMGGNWCQRYAIGADYKLNSHWSLNLEWGYFQTDIPKDAHYSDGSFSNILDTGPTLGEGETSLTVGVKYSW